MVPYPADQLRMWEISPRVNSPKNDDPSLWKPVNAEIGRLKKENDVKLVCLKRENKLKGLF